MITEKYICENPPRRLVQTIFAANQPMESTSVSGTMSPLSGVRTARYYQEFTYDNMKPEIQSLITRIWDNTKGISIMTPYDEVKRGLNLRAINGILAEWESPSKYTRTFMKRPNEVEYQAVVRSMSDRFEGLSTYQTSGDA